MNASVITEKNEGGVAPVIIEERVEEVAPEVSADTVAFLYFEQMKQITTLSVAVAGGTVTLLQTLLQDDESRALAMAAGSPCWCSRLF